MTDKQREIYIETIRRLARGGATDPTAQIIALAEEIERYRDTIRRQDDEIEKLKQKKKRQRYTAWDPGLGRFVVPLLHKADFGPISFYVKEGGEDVATNGRGDSIYTGREPDLVYGEVIDWLAELENKEG